MRNRLRVKDCTNSAWKLAACRVQCNDQQSFDLDKEISDCDDGHNRYSQSAEACRDMDPIVREKIITNSKATFSLSKRDTASTAEDSTASSAPNSTPVSPTAGGSGLSGMATAGVAVGAAFGGIGVIAAVAYLASKWKKNSSHQRDLITGALPSFYNISAQQTVPSPYESSPMETSHYWSSPVWSTTQSRNELDDTVKPQELHATPTRAELPAYGYY
ncbi:hypothetical protein F5Y15DRAFT_414085 [Xylariaceae sp. FL0016]|nr:hypothetical protein F5Y15DRAFT_414085 [Xylariaceae sp. FL0016]